MTAAARRSRRLLLITSLVVPLALAGAAEPVARTVLHDRIAQAAGRSLGDGVRVDTGGGLALVDLFERRLPHVTLSSGDARFGALQHVSVRIRLDDVRLGGGGPGAGTAARVHAEADLPSDALLELAGSTGQRVPVTGVSPDTAAGTLRFQLGGGLGLLVLAPRVHDGRLGFSVASLQILGRPAPDRMTAQVEQRLAARADGRDYPLSLRATSATVTADGLHTVLDGGPTGLR